MPCEGSEAKVPRAYKSTSIVEFEQVCVFDSELYCNYASTLSFCQGRFVHGLTRYLVPEDKIMDKFRDCVPKADQV